MNLKNIWRRLRGKKPDRFSIPKKMQSALLKNALENGPFSRALLSSHIQCRCQTIQIPPLTDEQRQQFPHWADEMYGTGEMYPTVSFSRAVLPTVMDEVGPFNQEIMDQISRAMAIPPAFFAPDNLLDSVDDNPNAVLG